MYQLSRAPSFHSLTKISFFAIVLFFITGCKSYSPPSNQGVINQPYVPVPPNERYQQHHAIVKTNRYRKKRLLNNSEAKLFWKLVNFCRTHNYQVFAQVSLGEILSVEETDAYNAINAKRVDYCLTDKKFYPLAVIEYHGPGHFNETSEKRDEIKKEAAESAGIVFHVVTENDMGYIEKHLNEELIPKLGRLEKNFAGLKQDQAGIH